VHKGRVHKGRVHKGRVHKGQVHKGQVHKRRVHKGPRRTSHKHRGTEANARGRTMRLNEISYRIIGAAMKVHTALGSGVLESVYAQYLVHEFEQNGLQFQHQVQFKTSHHGVKLQRGYFVDFVVEKLIVVEIKCVEKVLPVHRSQLLSYLKLTGLPLGLLLNFKVPHLREGIERFVNAPASELE
jgi:GxxExxY protein